MSAAATEKTAWDDTSAFTFPLDFPKQKKREVGCGSEKKVSFAVPFWAHSGKNSADDGDYTDQCAFAAGMIFAMLSHCGGSEAVLVVDSTLPRAVASPLARPENDDMTVKALVDYLNREFRSDSDVEALPRMIAAQRIDEDGRQRQKPRQALVGTIALCFTNTAHSVSIDTMLAGFDVCFVLDPSTTGVNHLIMYYNSKMFAAASAQVWSGMVSDFIAAVASSGAGKVDDLNPINPRVESLLLREWQSDELSLPKEETNRTLTDLFMETIERRCNGAPEAQVAIMDPDKGVKWSYRELDTRSTQIAAFLHREFRATADARWGVDATVGIFMPRCAEFFCILLGIHKAGGAYLSLDPEFPPERVDYALSDSNALCVFTFANMISKLKYTGGPMFAIDQLWDAVGSVSDADCQEVFSPLRAKPESPCYLIYTSGSTGKPKGVLIEHRSALTFVLSEKRMFRVDNTSRVMQGFSTSFDASVEEIWLAFGNGATMVIIQKSVMAVPDALVRFVNDNNVTIFSAAPTLFASVKPASLLDRLEVVVVGGEACNQDVVNDYSARPGRVMINSYGPTEATVACTWDVCSPGRAVNIGRAQPGYFACVLGPDNELLPPGTPGELVIAGPGVARGYVNRDDLTAEKFLPCPFPLPEGFERMYKTGDLVRWKPDVGRIECLGRIDAQVKLRGFRIELGEIESVMATVDGVDAAVVHLRDKDPGQLPYLCGYVLCSASFAANFDEAKIRAVLQKQLPGYMVPARLCMIQEIPRAPTGKLDRKQLPPPPPLVRSKDSGPAPSSRMEQLVFKEWCSVLRGVTPTTNENFFDVGGQSMLAGRLVSAFRRHGFDEFNFQDVYASPTIQKMAARLEVLAKSRVAQLRELPDRDEPTALIKFGFLVWQLAVVAASILVTCLIGTGYIMYFFYLMRTEWVQAYLRDRAGRSTAFLWPLTVCFLSLQCFTYFAQALYMWLLCPLLKWLFLGTVRETTVSVWSFYFLRYWTVRALTNFPIWTALIVPGTPAVSLLYRMYGAAIGRSCVLQTGCRLVDADLWSVGDDCYISDHCWIGTSEVIDSMLLLRHVVIRNGSSVYSRAVLRGGATVGDNCVITPLTLVGSKDVVGDGELWSGSPGHRTGMAPRPILSGSSVTALISGSVRQTTSHKVIWGILQVLFLLTLQTLIYGPYFLSFVLGCYALQYGTPWWTLLVLVPCTPLIVAAVLIYQHLILFLFRLIVFPTGAREGNYAIDQGIFERKLLFDQLHRTSLAVAHPMYASMFCKYYLKAMGVKCGDNVECSNLHSFTPGLVSFGSGCFIADFVGVNPLFVIRGSFTFQQVEVEDRAFVGNGAVLRPGMLIERNGLLGLSSYMPAGNVEANRTYAGSPAIHMPRNVKAAFGDDCTYNPSTSLVVQRFFWELFRCTSPATVTLFSGIIAFYLYPMRLSPAWGFRELLVASYGILLIAPIIDILLIVLLKWIIIGRHRKEEYPLHSTGVWRSEFILDLLTVTISHTVLNMFRGTQVLPAIFRMLGAKIGANCYLDTVYLPEMDLIRVGNNCSINDSATLQTHLFEDRVMKCDALEIRDRVSIGQFGIVLYESVAPRGCTYAPLTLLMKGEQSQELRHYHGVFAKLCSPPDIMYPKGFLAAAADGSAVALQAFAASQPASMRAPRSMAPPSSKLRDVKPHVSLSMWLRGTLDAEPDEDDGGHSPVDITAASDMGRRHDVVPA